MKNSSVANDESSKQGHPLLLYLVYFIYFFCGMTQCFESVFLPEIKEYFHLTYQQQMYAMFAKNLPFLGAVAVGVFAVRFGYRNSLIAAVLLFSAGTLLLVPGWRTTSYPMILCAYFLIGMGFTVQMVAGNSLLATLGTASGTSSRMNFANATGAFAQIVAPAGLSFLVPAMAASVGEKLPYIERLFVVLGVTLLIIAAAVFTCRSYSVRGEATPPAVSSPSTAKSQLSLRGAVGFLVLFLVLGMEAALFGFFRNYLESADITGMSSHSSERLFTVYFAVFALGRLAASWLQKTISAEINVILFLVPALVCLGGAMLSRGTLAIVFIVSIGFFISILFPSLYVVYSRSAQGDAGPVSGLLTMGFLGCAVIPVLQGRLADKIGLRGSYGTGLAIYGFVLVVVAMEIWGKRGAFLSPKDDRARA